MASTKPNDYRSRRWSILAAYTAVAGWSQALWFSLASLLSTIQNRYDVSEFAASTLLLVFPLVYTVLSLPAGMLIDRRGYRTTAGLGAIVMTGFAFVRIHDSFTALLVGQVGIAIAQPFVVNGISKLVSDWFPEQQQDMAIGIGTMGMFLGIGVGLAASPFLESLLGFKGTMACFASVSALCCTAFLFFCREAGRAKAKDQTVHLAHEPLILSTKSPMRMISNGRLVLLFTIAFIGMGIFNGVTTWLEKILGANGIVPVTAGMIGGALILGGILGAVAIPAVVQRIRQRKPFIVISAVAALAILPFLWTLSSLWLLLVLGGVLGFFYMPVYGLLLALSAETAGERNAGTATGLLLLAGNAGSVAIMGLMALIRENSASWLPVLYLMMGLLTLTLILGVFVSESSPRDRGISSPYQPSEQLRIAAEL